MRFARTSRASSLVGADSSPFSLSSFSILLLSSVSQPLLLHGDSDSSILVISTSTTPVFTTASCSRSLKYCAKLGWDGEVQTAKLAS